MNPGPIEQAGKVAGGVIDALKVQPLLLVMVLLQVILLVAVAWAGSQRLAAERERFTMLMNLCGPKGEAP
jgi:hypothetical protein